MDKYLVLVSDKNSHYFYCLKNTDYFSIYSIYRKMSVLERIIRKILIFLGLDISIYYDDWKYDCNCNYSKAIIEDGTLDGSIFEHIRRKFPNIQLIYWFRNSLDAVDYKKSKQLHIKHASMCDRVLSFDKDDSLKYGYEYIENAYARDENLQTNDTIYDMIYLGSDKSRYDNIVNVVNYTKRINWNNYIYIFSKTRPENTYVHKSFVSYNDYLKLMVKSKAILDVIDTSYQNGYSLRVFESLFYEKKLITNMKDITLEPFYNPNNIYVIDFEDENSFIGLKEFLDIPYQKIHDDILNKYNFYNWIKRI